MPTTYAHYAFGRDVLQKLDPDFKKTIKKNIDLYNIGLHGPDILFYFKPLKSNEVSSLGHAIHGRTADAFFENARKTITGSSSPDAALAYIAGFICHYMLDSQCHPQIRKYEQNFTHSEIEAELDRALMLKDGLNPLSFKPTGHINPTVENARCISGFFGLTGEQVQQALKSMKFYLNVLVAPGRVKRSVISGLLRVSGNYESMIHLMMKHEPEKEFESINENLLQLYNQAIEPAARLMEEYAAEIEGKEKINSRFERNFG
ncbi:MAG: zinc dependent phospholipase C family protein [Sedimentibacter sp.]|uniref:zinc dependent phospholipase C family protein n=1 Tax=Sedimentibacter sp. TaxID=1960295 RepID=UPI0031587ADA